MMSPLPPHTNISTSAPQYNSYGMYTPNDSTVSLPERHTHTFGSSPQVADNITFADNPSPQDRKHVQRPSTAHGGHGAEPATPSPPTPHSGRRPRGLSFRKLSSRSMTPTPATPRSPPLPSSPVDPTTPKASPFTDGREYVGNMQLCTPKSTDVRRHHETADHLTNTPRSPRSRESLDSTPGVKSSASSVRSMKKKASFSSFRSLGSRALGFVHPTSGTASPRRGSDAIEYHTVEPNTPKSPLATRSRSRQASAQGYVDGHTKFANAFQAAAMHGQRAADDPGLLGPAFDLRPPSLATSPRASTFPSSGMDERVAFAALPPPVPPIPRVFHMRQVPSVSSSITSILKETHVRPQPSPLALVDAQKVTQQRKDAKIRGVERGDEMYAPFNIAFGTRMRYFEWLENAENVFRLKRFGKAMTGTSGWEGPGSVIGGKLVLGRLWEGVVC